MTVEYGVVKKYDRHTKRGILEVLVNNKKTGEELHIFLADRHHVELKDRIPRFIRERIVEPLGRGRGFLVQYGDEGPVRVGDQLAFERSERDQGSVKRWSSAHEYMECLRELKGPYYRVIRRDKAEPWKFEVVCENLTLPELKAQYPIGSDDPLEGCEFEFWNFSHTRPTRGGGYYHLPPGWDRCYWGDPRVRK